MNIRRRLCGACETVRQSERPSVRPGVTTVEFAVLLVLFLTIVLGLLETAFGVFQYHAVSQAARHGARLAIVRGELASPLGIWDPNALGNPYTVNADVNAPVPNAMRNYLAGVNLSQTTIRIDWLDGDNALESRVRVRVTSVYQPFITFLFTSNWTLVSEATMPIAH